jgi:glycosyltransferase involved in cell wall biosynthesis
VLPNQHSAVIGPSSTVSIVLPSPSPHNSISLQTKLLATQLEGIGINTTLVNLGTTDAQHRLGRLAKSSEFIIWPFGGFDRFLVPFMYTAKNILFIYHNITPARLLWIAQPLVGVRALLGRLQLLCLPKHYVWVAVSDFNRRELERFGFSKVHLCPNIVVGGNLEVARTEPVRLLFVGRISPNKNCIELLAQVSKAANHMSTPVELVIVGDVKPGCRHGHSFQRQVSDLSSHPWLTIRWMRGGVTQDDLASFYRTAWLYLSTSLHEGFGLPACEAIEHGTPALYLECGGLESVLEKRGMVPLSERASFWSHIARLVTSEVERRELLHSQHQVTRNYTMPKISETIRLVYAPLLHVGY